ncbi:MAG TPA: ComEC/Rec2 family competence protein [Candidatus Acidoferrales bacterium]|jgi:competence protein ComEC
MKLPTLWIAAAFAAGIALASFKPEASFEIWIAAAAATIMAGGILLWRGRATEAWILALAGWLALGGVALGVERGSLPADHVTRRIASGALDTSVALRWSGRLRDDPAVLPWGRQFVIDLSSVEVGGQTLKVSGGLRLNLYPEAKTEPTADEASLADLQAGDEVEVLAKAKPPRNFMDPGAFDRRGYLARQKIDLVGTLRDSALLQITGRPGPSILQRMAQARGRLLAQLDTLFAGQPQRAAVLRAMLLGDRSFVDSNVVTEFQETSAYHVLVLAGLHVGALALFLFWICRRLRFPLWATSVVTLIALGAFVGVVQDRPPILRAALMAALYICARPLFRRVDLVNTVSLAALALLVWRPSSLTDSSFALSFVAAGVIAALAIPWIERSSEPYRQGLRHLGDVTRDGAYAPKVAQFRVEMRWAAAWIAARMPARIAAHSSSLLSLPVRIALRLWEIILISFAIQWGMMPLLALDFHRVSLGGVLTNIPAVILTGIIVPLGFLVLGVSFVWMRLAMLLARALGLLAGGLLATVAWFAAWPRISYRIPGPPVWLLFAFFAAFICLAAAARAAAARRMHHTTRRLVAARLRPMEWISALGLAALTIVVASYPFAPRYEHGKLEVDVLDVGQGDSIFTAFPSGRTMLIDGGGLAGSEVFHGQRSGPDVGEEVVSPFLWSRGLKRLDVVALSHAHHDHLDGLHAVIRNFRVGELWVGRDEETPAFRQLLAEARARGVKIVHRTSGETFDWDGVRGGILWPPDSATEAEASNDDSLVMRLADANVRFLLPGDIQKKVEESLAEAHAPLAADFLKAPHHGSKTSSTPDFLAAVSPRVAVASVGEDNPFGHPAASTVERYEQAGIRLLRTDRDGEVTGITDGSTLEIRTFAETRNR